MERYDYLEAVKSDVRVYLGENYTQADLAEQMRDFDSFEQKLNDELWIEDSVTGNASGSYTFSNWRAEEYIVHNLDLLAEACHDFGTNTDLLKNGAEACDVTIRCYLLGQAIYETLEELKNTLEV